MSYPLPPDTRAVGTGNPPADINQVIDALTGMGEAGYIKPSGDTSGATDTAAVAAAEAAGLTVVLGPATYWGNFTKASLVHWQGAGRGKTILKAPAASNAPVLTSAGFAAATLTGSVSAGISAFAIRDMSFDGNAAAQTVPAAFGVGIYGADFLLENVSVRNCLSVDGLYTEWGPAGGSAMPDKSMEASFRHLRVHDNTLTGAGWHYRGPHDSSTYGCWVYNNTTSAYGFWPESSPATLTATGLSGTAVSSTPATITLNTTLSLPAAGTVTMPSAGGTVTITYTGLTATTMTGCSAAGGSGNYTSNVVTPPQFSGSALTAYGMHVWGAHSIGVVIDGSAMFSGCSAEGAVTGQVLARAGSSSWYGGRIFNPGGNTSYGLQLGDTANQCTGFILGSPQVTQFQGGAASKAYVNVVNEASGRYEALLSLSSTAQAVYGTFSVPSYHKIVFESGGSVTPSIAYAAGAGTGPPASAAVANATDRRGQASWGTGTATTGGAQVTVTFAQPKPGTPAIAIWPENAATAKFLPYVANWSSASFQVAFQLAPDVSQAAGTYQVGYADVTG